MNTFCPLSMGFEITIHFGLVLNPNLSYFDQAYRKNVFPNKDKLKYIFGTTTSTIYSPSRLLDVITH